MMTLTEKRLNEIEHKLPRMQEDISELEEDIKQIQNLSCGFIEITTKIDLIENSANAFKKNAEDAFNKYNLSIRKLENKSLEESTKTTVLQNSAKEQENVNIQNVKQLDNLGSQLISITETQRSLIENITSLRSQFLQLQDLIQNTVKDVEKSKKQIDNLNSKICSLPVEEMRKNIENILRYLPELGDRVITNKEIMERFAKLEKMQSQVYEACVQLQLEIR